MDCIQAAKVLEKAMVYYSKPGGRFSNLFMCTLLASHRDSLGITLEQVESLTHVISVHIGGSRALDGYLVNVDPAYKKVILESEDGWMSAQAIDMRSQWYYNLIAELYKLGD